MFWLRTNYEPPSAGIVLFMVAVAVALALAGAIRLAVVLLVAFAAFSIFNWSQKRSGRS